MKNYPNINSAWGSIIVEELIRLGITHFCISPGSRSTPITSAIARHPKANSIIHYDERGLAFYAMGLASSLKQPVVLVCTSGTAAANFYPAIIEASKKKLPLIVITADRPPELRFTGSVQTIDQVGLFGKYTVWQFDMPCPDLAIKPNIVLTTIDQAVYMARRKSGVVHLNMMFRDPLNATVIKTPWVDYLKPINKWLTAKHAFTSYVKTFEQVGIEQTKVLANQLNAVKKGIIIVGKLKNDAEGEQVLNLAKTLGWPIFPDVASPLRLNIKNESIINYFDLMLIKDADSIKVDGILHLGGRMTSKRYYEWVRKQDLSVYMMVLNHSLRNDPDHIVTNRVESTIDNFCETIRPLIKKTSKQNWFTKLIKRNVVIDQKLSSLLKSDERLNEINTPRLISQLIKDGDGLYLANSMPIRDMNMFGAIDGHAVHVAGNRGASGIDGLIASAAGFAEGLKQRTTLITGDLSALHDLNSLSLLRFINQPLIIVIMNNGGGGIFSFLPIATEKDVAEKYFGTPHGFTFANAAHMFELNYANPLTINQFKKAYTQAQGSLTPTIIEVVTDRQSNVALHQAIQEQL